MTLLNETPIKGTLIDTHLLLERHGNLKANDIPDAPFTQNSERGQQSSGRILIKTSN